MEEAADTPTICSNLQQYAAICSNFLQEYVQMLVYYSALISIMVIHVFQDDVCKTSMHLVLQPIAVVLYFAV